jgi:hypothetical protein
MTHIPVPVLTSLTAAHWRMLADYLQVTSKITEQQIARVIYQYHQDQAALRLAHAAENMRASLEAKDYKRFFQEKFRFGQAEKDLLEAEKYFRKYVEPEVKT